MSKTSSKDFYNGNPNIKKSGVVVNYNKSEVEEYIKCSEDPIYFIRKYVKIISLDDGLVSFDMRDYQERMIDAYDNHRFCVTLTSRQTGKSITVAAYILHYILFNPETTSVILANKAATAREILSRIKRMFENLPSFLQTGVKEYNKGSIILSNDSTLIAAATSSDSIRGLSVNFLFLDEFAFVDNADEFMEGVYPTIASGKKSKVIITSTPNGMNLFYKIYDEAVRGVNSFKPTRVDYWEVPRYDDEWKQETIRNIGERRFRQEFGNDFAGSGNTLISGEKLAALTWNTPIEETETVSIYERSIPNHVYVITVDVSEGAGYDYSVISVFDITNNEKYTQVAMFRSNLTDPIILPELIVSMAETYNNAYVIVESNSIGSKVCYILYYELEYEYCISTSTKSGNNVITGGFGSSSDIGIRTTKKTKMIGCSVLKSMIENDVLAINDFNTVTELLSFVKKGQSYEASAKSTDDIVMTLVIFAWFTSQTYFSDMTNSNVGEMIRDKLKSTIDDTLVPFGIIDTHMEYDSNDSGLYDSVLG